MSTGELIIIWILGGSFILNHFISWLVRRFVAVNIHKTMIDLYGELVQARERAEFRDEMARAETAADMRRIVAKRLREGKPVFPSEV